MLYCSRGRAAAVAVGSEGDGSSPAWRIQRLCFLNMGIVEANFAREGESLGEARWRRRGPQAAERCHGSLTAPRSSWCKHCIRGLQISHALASDDRYAIDGLRTLI